MAIHNEGIPSRDRAAWHISGFVGLVGVIVIDVMGGWLIGTGYGTSPGRVVLGIALLAVGSMAMTGLTRVRAGEPVLVTGARRSLGMLHEPGFHFTIPLTRRVPADAHVSTSPAR